MASIKQLHVNGSLHPIDADPERSLLSVLRDDLGLTGSKYGCGEGRCGACTVLIDGQSTRSCVTRLGSVRDKPVLTIEGLAAGGKLHPLQEAFLEAGAMQCGYCIPGMILTARSFLDECRGHVPSEAEVREALSGTLCRCTGYQKIVEAVIVAARQLNSWPEELRRAG